MANIDVVTQIELAGALVTAYSMALDNAQRKCRGEPSLYVEEDFVRMIEERIERYSVVAKYIDGKYN